MSTKDQKPLEAGFLQRFFGSNPAVEPPSSTKVIDTVDAADSGPSFKPCLKAIKTPHEEAISHPELAFSPSDIGIWEVNKIHKENAAATSSSAASKTPKADTGSRFSFW